MNHRFVKEYANFAKKSIKANGGMTKGSKAHRLEYLEKHLNYYDKGIVTEMCVMKVITKCMDQYETI